MTLLIVNNYGNLRENVETGGFILGKIFNLDDCKFTVWFYPNGKQEDPEFTSLYLQLVAMPPSKTLVNVDAHFYVIDTATQKVVVNKPFSHQATLSYRRNIGAGIYPQSGWARFCEISILPNSFKIIAHLRITESEKPVSHQSVLELKEYLEQKIQILETGLCSLCMENIRSHVCNPCGHVFCFACLEKVNGACPTCRQSIISAIKFYV